MTPWSVSKHHYLVTLLRGGHGYLETRRDREDISPKLGTPGPSDLIYLYSLITLSLHSSVRQEFAYGSRVLWRNVLLDPKINYMLFDELMDSSFFENYVSRLVMPGAPTAGVSPRLFLQSNSTPLLQIRVESATGRVSGTLEILT